MPYIKPEDRKVFQELLRNFKYLTTSDPGELNYLLTKICLWYLDTHHYSYKTMNEVVGALECAKQEFYRKVVVPHEEIQKEKNGDVYI